MFSHFGCASPKKAASFAASGTRIIPMDPNRNFFHRIRIRYDTRLKYLKIIAFTHYYHAN